MLYNHLIKQNKLETRYPKINNGEKIKFIYLKVPNPIMENVVSFIADFPKELEISKYVDHDLQFDKSFVEPVRAILDSIGWSVEKKVTLESFFV